MNMYSKIKMNKTSIEINASVEGETIEEKIERIVNNKEPITDGAPIVYTDRSEGVQPQYNIRTDRFEIAVEAMDAVDRTNKAKREDRAKERETIKLGKKGEENKENNSGAEPTQGTT